MIILLQMHFLDCPQMKNQFMQKNWLAIHMPSVMMMKHMVSLLPFTGSTWTLGIHNSSFILPASLDSACTTLKITADTEFLNSVKNGYKNDMWCKLLPSANHSFLNLKFCDGLWYIGDCLIIPHTANLCETLFALAHDVLRHSGFVKTYGSL